MFASLRRTIHLLTAWAVLSWLGLAPAAAQKPLGSEFRVNSYTTGYQGRPAIAAQPNREFVVVWGGSSGVSGQRFDVVGNPLGGELQISGPGSSPDVATDAAGNFVVVWVASDQSGSGVFGRRFDAAGNVLGGGFRANTYTTGAQSEPAVAAAANGDFVVVWRSSGQVGDDNDVFGQRFDAAGNALGGEFQVNTYTTYNQQAPQLASHGEGDFVVVWESGSITYPFDGAQAPSTHLNFDIMAQRYDVSGVPIGGEFQVNTYTTDYQRTPAVTMRDDGAFVVAWSSGYTTWNLEAQRFDSKGNSVGGELRINTQPGDHGRSRVAFVTDDEFVLVWHGSSFIADVVGRRFDFEGNPLGGVFQVNTYTTYTQSHASVASAPDGHFLVVWEHKRDIHGRRFVGPDFLLSSSGSCLGPQEVTVSNAPPNSEVAVIAAASINGFTKGGTICSGTELELGEPFFLPPTWVIVDGEGNGSANLPGVGTAGCYIQALAIADCSTSNTLARP